MFMSSVGWTTDTLEWNRYASATQICIHIVYYVVSMKQTHLRRRVNHDNPGYLSCTNK